MEKITRAQAKEAVEFLKKFDRKVVCKFGWWFKLIGNDKVEIFNIKQTKFTTINIATL